MYEGMKRQIQVVSIQSNEVLTRESAASTWGELKEEFPEISMASRGSNAWLKKGKVDLKSDSTPLPNDGEPLVIYLYVDKMSSGNVRDIMPEISDEDIEEAEEIYTVVEEVVSDLIN